MDDNNLLPFRAAAATLADMIPGDNSELLNAVADLARGTSAIKSLYLWGDNGSGKSTLLRAACAEAKRYGQATYFIDAHPERDILPPLGDGLLVVDNVSELSAAAQTTLFDWHNRAATKQQQFLLASDSQPPAALPLGKELASRLAAGLVFRLQPLSDRDKSQALAALAQRHGFQLPADIADLLLTRLPRNMHSLAAALAQLDNFLLQQKKPLSSRRVHSWLNRWQPAAAPVTNVGGGGDSSSDENARAE